MPTAPTEIRGAGPVGMALALALAQQGRPVRVIDRATAAAYREDRRTLALSEDHRIWLQTLSAWPEHAATAITWVHVSQAGHFGRTVIRSADLGLPALGWTVPYTALIDALRSALAATTVSCHFNVADCPTLPPEHWRIHAEGAATTPIAHDYGQVAVVADLTASEPAAGRAWERFTADGPLALLPVRQGFAAVCIAPPDQAERWCHGSDRAFLDHLERRLGGRLQLTACGPRAAFPLVLRVRPETVIGREVWIGNAAQMLHPVSGQGLNLGLRDARALARALVEGDASVAAFAARRQRDRRQTITLTDLLARGFLGNPPLITPLRSLALQAIDLLPDLRRRLSRQLIYGATD